MSYDLDGADLAEVRRRVVDPVLSALLTAGEVDEVWVQVGSPYEPVDGQDEEDRAPYVYAVIVSDGDMLAVPVAKLVFNREDAADGLGELYGAVQHWICETSFGWGQWRDGPLPQPPPSPAAAATAGRRLLEFYPEPEVPSPLWEQGVNVPLDRLPLPQALVTDVAAWVRRWDRLTDEDEDEDEDDVEWPGWVAVVQEMEPERRRLVAALRQELPDDMDIAQPIPLDEMTLRWRAGHPPRLPPKS